MLSQSTINELLDYDIVFVGNIGAVAAASFARKHRDRFKIGVMHLEESVSEPSLLPLGPPVIKVSGKPQVEMIHQRIVRMRPEQRVLEVEGGKRLGYKILVYGEGKPVSIQQEDGRSLTQSTPFMKPCRAVTPE